MTFEQFARHLWECQVGVLNMSLGEPVKRIVIRTETGDAEVAAIHREGNTLVIDLGRTIPKEDCHGNKG